MKFAVVSILVGSAIAFAPAPTGRVSTAVRDTLNGWTPDESKFAWGLPGAIAPFEDGFDPLGLATGTPLGTMKQWREAEVNHGRVAMLAAVGILVTEEPLEFHPLFEAFNKDIGPAIRHLDEVDAVSPFFLTFLTIGIGSVEWNRALVGFAKPEGSFAFQQLNENYYPGDVRFDPLGLKPSDPEEFALIQTKELQNGRLAMIGAMGMIVQELVDGKEIFVSLGLASDRFDPSSVPIQF